MIKNPIIVVNFKVYENAIGKGAVKLAKILDNAAIESNSEIAICANAADIREIHNSVKIPVFGQHVDGVDFGAYTGKILPKAIKDNGASGSLINHSEDRYDFESIKSAILKLRELKMISIVCAKDDFEAQKIAKLHPDYVAVEPPELIGGDVSVTTADPNIVIRSVKKVKAVASDVRVLCGAGVKTGEDVRKAIEFGCVGVLLASGITKAKSPKKAILDMCSGLK